MPSLETDFDVTPHLPQSANGTADEVMTPPATASTTSERIRQRLQAAQASFFANDNIAPYLKEGELETLQEEVVEQVRGLLKTLVIDVDNDHNTAETAERVAKMYLHEVFKGRYHPQPKVASFPQRERAGRDLHRWSHHGTLPPAPTTWSPSWATAGLASSLVNRSLA